MPSFVTPPSDRLTAALRRSYRIDRELGAGGMATVYLAHDLRHERDVAIKVWHPDLGVRGRAVPPSARRVPRPLEVRGALP